MNIHKTALTGACLSLITCGIVAKAAGGGNVKAGILAVLGGAATFGLLFWLLPKRRAKVFGPLQYLVLYGLTTLSATLVIFALAQIPIG